MFPAKVGSLCDPKLRKVCLLHRNPDVCEHRQHLFAAARGNAAALLLQSNREKHVQVIKIPKRRMAGIGALNDTDCPYLCAHRCMQLLRVAVIRAVRHRLTIVQRAEDLGQETLVVHIAARLVQALRRALLRAEEKVIDVEHIALQLCLQGRGQRGLSGGTAAVNGNEYARLRGCKCADTLQEYGFKISHTKHLPS